MNKTLLLSLFLTTFLSIIKGLMALTNQPVPQTVDSNRATLIGLPRQGTLSKRVQKADYAPFAIVPQKDAFGFGNVKADRIAKVKKQYGNLSDNDISNILALGAPSRDNLQRNKITPADKESLRQLAATHQISYNPSLNSQDSAKMFVNKKIAEAQRIKNPKQRAAALAKWQNMTDEFKDLDRKPETPDNYIIRNKNDPNDIYSIDGMRLTDRTKSVVQRGVFDVFPTSAARRDNKEFIDKIYKKYLRKYLKPEDRVKHPFNAEMAQQIDAKLTADESLFSRISAWIRATLASIGVTIKNQDGSTKLTTPHYGYIVSKVSSDYYRGFVIPQLVAQSVWASHVPQGYSFVLDPDGYLQNKKFRESMLAVYKSKSNTISSNPTLLVQSLQQHGNELVNDGVQLRVNTQGSNVTVDIIDAQAREQDYRRAAIAQIKGGAKPNRSTIFQEYTQRGGGIRNYSARANPIQQQQQIPMTPPVIAPPQQMPMPVQQPQYAPVQQPVQQQVAEVDDEGDVVMGEES